jgi:hypothetical protein
MQEGRCVTPLHCLLVTSAVVDVLTDEHNQGLQQLILIDGIGASSMDGVVGHYWCVVIGRAVMQQIIDDVIELDLIIV